MIGLIGNEATFNATTNNANLNTSILSRGSGIDARNLVNAFSSDDYTSNGTQTEALTNNDYFQFQISTMSGYQVSLNTLDANFRRSSNGPNTFIWRYSIDGINFTDIGSAISYIANVNNGTAQTQIDLSTITDLQNVPFGTTMYLHIVLEE